MRSSLLLAAALLLGACDDRSSAEGPSTETETVTLCRADGTPVTGTRIRQVASEDWLDRVASGRAVVLDSCLTDVAGSCALPRREGIAWEAFVGDSLAAWSKEPRLVARPAALWTGSSPTGGRMFLEGTSVRAAIGPAGVWAATAPQGTFSSWRLSARTPVPSGTAVLDTSVAAWDSTRSLGTVLSIMDPSSPFRIEWFATLLEAPSGLRVPAPSVPVGFDGSDSQCVGICPILVVSPGIGASPGLAGRIRVGPHVAGVVGGAVLHVRMSSTTSFQTLVRGLGRDSTVGSTTWMPNNVGFDPDWVVYRTTGALDTLSLETTNVGTLQVLDVQIRDSSGVRISIRR